MLSESPPQVHIVLTHRLYYFYHHPSSYYDLDHILIFCVERIETNSWSLISVCNLHNSSIYRRSGVFHNRCSTSNYFVESTVCCCLNCKFCSWTMPLWAIVYVQCHVRSANELVLLQLYYIDSVSNQLMSLMENTVYSILLWTLLYSYCHSRKRTPGNITSSLPCVVTSA